MLCRIDVASAVTLPETSRSAARPSRFPVLRERGEQVPERLDLRAVHDALRWSEKWSQIPGYTRGRNETKGDEQGR
jgi:hypothetical protein